MTGFIETLLSAADRLRAVAGDLACYEEGLDEADRARALAIECATRAEMETWEETARRRAAEGAGGEDA